MKKMKIGLLLAVVCGIFMISCNKTSIEPNPAKGPVNAGNNRINTPIKTLAPDVLANSVSYAAQRGYGLGFSVVFEQLTANFYGANLYMHYKLSTASTYSNGALPNTFSNPNAFYATGTLSSGTYNVFFSTATGTSYPAGSSSPVYNVVVP